MKKVREFGTAERLVPGGIEGIGWIEGGGAPEGGVGERTIREGFYGCEGGGDLAAVGGIEDHNDAIDGLMGGGDALVGLQER